MPDEPAQRIDDAVLIEKAQALTPDDAFVFYITYPTEPDEQVQVRMQVGYDPAPYGRVYRVYFDQYTGEVLGMESPDSSLADSFLNYWNDVLHFGTFGGWPSMVVWTLFPLLVPFFAVTGVILWRGRTHKRPRKVGA